MRSLCELYTSTVDCSKFKHRHLSIRKHEFDQQVEPNSSPIPNLLQIEHRMSGIVEHPSHHSIASLRSCHQTNHIIFNRQHFCRCSSTLVSTPFASFSTNCRCRFSSTFATYSRSNARLGEVSKTSIRYEAKSMRIQIESTNDMISVRQPISHTGRPCGRILWLPVSRAYEKTKQSKWRRSIKIPSIPTPHQLESSCLDC